MSKPNRFTTALESFSTRVLGPRQPIIEEKLKSLSVTTGPRLGSKSESQKPKGIAGYYGWYEDDGAVFAAVNSLAEFSTGGGYVNAMPGTTPSETPVEKPKELQLVDDLGEYLNLDSVLPNITRNMLIAGYCFPPEQEIITSVGIKPISTIEVGDEIQTLSGFNLVHDTMKRHYKGKMIKIYPFRNAMGITLTADHPVLVKTHIRCPIWETKYCISPCDHACTRKPYEKYQLEWKQAKDVTEDDYIIQPIPIFEYYDTDYIETYNDKEKEPCIINTDEDFFYLMGFYLGDGWLHGKKHENICFEINNKDVSFINKTSQIIRKLGRKPRIEITEGQNSVTVMFTHTALSKWINSEVGRGCENKKIPSKWLGLPENKKKALIQGLFDSDGCLSENRYTVSLINKPIIESLYLMLLSLDKAPSISLKDMPPCVINGKTSETKIQYVIRIHKKQYESFTENFFNGYVENNLILNRINKIETFDYDGFVYNVSVDKEPHICALGMLTHNCPVEVSMKPFPSKCKIKVIHPATITKIELGGEKYHGIEYIIQKVGEKEVKIDGKNLAWYVNYEMGNDKRGMSVIKAIEKLLATKMNTLDKIDKLLDRRLAPLIIWKTMRDETAIKEAISQRDADEDIFLGRLTPEEMESLAQVVDTEGDVKYWEYIEYIDRLIYKSLFAGDLDYWRQATQASATVLLELVDRNIMGIQRQIKRSTEQGIYQPLMELNGFDTVPRIVWNQEDAKFRGIQLERFMQTGVNTGFIQMPQFYEILKRSGLDLHMPDEVVVPAKGGTPTDEV